MRSQISSLERSALQFTSGSITLAVVTLACLYLQAHFAATAFAYLLVVLLFSLMGSFVASSALCIVAIAALAYYFAPPAFSLRIDAPRDLPVVVAFFIASIVGAHLIGTLRQEREAARVIAAKLQRSAADLEDREKRWRAIFEHNPAMYFMVDEAGTVLDVNTFGATQLGYARAELIGQSVLEVFLEEDRACVRTCLKDVGQTRTWDVQKVRKDGSVLWVRESAKAMLWADKQPIVLIACEDITERRRTELALQRSEAHLAQAQELSHTGSFSWNPTTGEAFWSQETFRIFQLDRQTVPLGPQLVVERTHPDDRASVQEIIDRAMRDPSDFEHEYRLLLPDGSVKHIHAQARATRTASGEIEFVGAATDITAARRAEQQLRRNEAYLAEAQHLSHTGSWSWDVYGLDFVYRSAEVDRLFGFRPQEPVSIETIRSRIHPDDLPRLEEVQRQAIEHKEGRFEYDFRILLPDGGIRRIHSVAHVVVGSDGKVSELIGTHMDVTGQHAARERLENTLAALRESEQRFRDYAENSFRLALGNWAGSSGHSLIRAHQRCGTFGDRIDRPASL
ncbi:PAS domain S-box-containing protein [Bradyrhizobium elkanii]